MESVTFGVDVPMKNKHSTLFSLQHNRNYRFSREICSWRNMFCMSFLFAFLYSTFPFFSSAFSFCLPLPPLPLSLSIHRSIFLSLYHLIYLPLFFLPLSLYFHCYHINLIRLPLCLFTTLVYLIVYLFISVS